MKEGANFGTRKSEVEEASLEWKSLLICSSVIECDFQLES